ncbi:hypothetical protein D3C83_09340 [compost metagenome]
MPASDAWKAWAEPWKLVVSVAGARNSRIAALIRSIASPSATSGPRLNDTVTAGSCPRWLMVSGPTPWVSRATELSGTSAPLPERT